jgi:hypothetical protein
MGVSKRLSGKCCQLASLDFLPSTYGINEAELRNLFGKLLRPCRTPQLRAGFAVLPRYEAILRSKRWRTARGKIITRLQLKRLARVETLGLVLGPGI